MDQPKEKNLELERLVFFSDAVVAIAITLLALDLKIERPASGHLSFADIANAWPKLVAFFLSFYIIAIFWRVHYNFFSCIKAVDISLFRYDFCWLLFIVLLPFTTSLMSEYYPDIPVVFVYSLNGFFITLFQNQIWDHVAVRPHLLKNEVSNDVSFDYRLTCNVGIINAFLATISSFISPLIAVIILSSRVFLFRIARKIYKPRNN